MSSHEIVCFQCGQPVGDPPRLNMIDEEPCAACSERLLDSLPGIFHTSFEPIGRLGEGQSGEDQQEVAKVDRQVPRVLPPEFPPEFPPEPA